MSLLYRVFEINTKSAVKVKKCKITLCVEKMSNRQPKFPFGNYPLAFCMSH